MAHAAKALNPVVEVGFTILSDPQDAVIDIIFVHGLQGHPQNTWTYTSKSVRNDLPHITSPSSSASKSNKARTLHPFSRFWKHKRTEPGPSEDGKVGEADNDQDEFVKENVFWPRDLLRDDFPQARIITFGYNTNISRGYHAVNQGNIFAHARDLLYALTAKRKKAPERNLVFIAHSLGGILVKEVLRRSEADPDAKINKIFTSTTAVFFFGTPHRGSKDWASFGEGIAGVAGRLLGVDTNDRVIHALLPTGPELELCRESFTTQWVKRGDGLTVRTFQESKAVAGVRWGGLNQLIVPPDSSSLDHPNQRARTIDADHIGMVKFSGKNDRVYEMVKEDIEDLIERTEPPQPLPTNGNESLRSVMLATGTEKTQTAGNVMNACVRTPNYYLPFSRNQKFVGRSDELDQLRDKLLVKKTCKKVAVVGLGGIGKTQVALEFAQWMKAQKPEYSIFWMPALSVESFEQACAEIVRRLKLTRTEDEKEDAKELVRRYLNDQAAGKWLLIFDNADDMETLYGSVSSQGLVEFLPENEDGLILVTSRHLEVALSLVGSDVIKLGKMTERDAAAFLTESLLRKDWAQDNAAAQFLKELDYLPLAIAQAVAFINTKGITITEYVRLLHDTNEDLVSLMSREFRDSTRYKHSANAVATTWIVSFEQILKEDPIAADLLAFMSSVEWKGILRSMLPPVYPDVRMVSAIGTICAYSFAVQRDKEEVYDMHRLVHLATRIWLDRNDRGVEARSNAMRHVAQIFPSHDYRNRDLWRKYLPHASRLLAIEKDAKAKEKHRLLLKVGLCLLTDGRTKEAISWLTESCQWRENNLPEDDPDRLTSQHELARAYQANGQIKEAVALLEHVVAVQQVLAEDHPARLVSQHALARAYQANGQIKEAVALLEHVLAVQQVLAEDHPNQLASQHALAMAYQANGQIKEAVALLEHVVSVQQVLAEDHPARLVSQHNLARAYQANGQIKEAVALLEHVVAVQQVLAEDHPAQLASQHALASAYTANGQIKEAVALLEHVVAVQQVLAEDHPARLASQHALASAYTANGQIKEAVALLEHVLTVKQVLAEDHPNQLASQHELAIAYKANGQIKEAVALLDNVVVIKRTVLSESHPSRIVSEEALAIFRAELPALH